MANRSRLLFLLNYLLEHTDETHSALLSEIQEAAKAQGLTILPRTFNEDLEEISAAGYHVEVRRRGYFKTYRINKLLTLNDQRRLLHAVRQSNLPADDRARLEEKLLQYGSLYEQEAVKAEEESTPRRRKKQN